MTSLDSYISFDVRYLFTGTPSLQLTVNTTLTSLEQQDLIGYFSITQPDCISESGNYGSPDIYYLDGSLKVFTKELRFGTDQLFQKGNYTITLYADHPDYTPGAFARAFNFNYKPVTQSIYESFDVFTPLLKYIDRTVYSKGDFTILSETSSWAATSPAGVIDPSSTSTFDLLIGGNYYDSTYNTIYVKTLLYQHITDTWLTVSQSLSYAQTSKSYIPQSMITLLTYLDVLKASIDARQCCATAGSLYEKAAVLYQHIRNKICAQIVAELKNYFDEFYRITHNYQSYVYQNTGAIIPPYDFTTGCSEGSSTTTILFEGIVGGETKLTGTSNILTGFTAGSDTITLSNFTGVRVEVQRGGQDGPTIGAYTTFTKILSSDSIVLATPLAEGEYLKIKTVPR